MIVTKSCIKQKQEERVKEEREGQERYCSKGYKREEKRQGQQLGK